MSEKASTLTLRLTAEEAQQIEKLKALTGKRSASDAIRYVVAEYPRFCEHYKQKAQEWREKEMQYRKTTATMLRLSETLGEVLQLPAELSAKT